MSKQFLKKGELQLVNGGYLSNKEGNPVSNTAFVQVQRHAEYIVAFAKGVKTKDFNGKKADSLEEFRKEIAKMVSGNKVIEFIKKPKDVARPTSDKLKNEALAFINFQEDVSNTEKINNFLQEFAILQEFEEFGLFFEEEIVKLNQIYTMKEVIDAVTASASFIL